ncbi:Glycosyltransferase family 10 (fucosyltransferase) [Rosistilla ulvae]|uniref:Glycosyltransferase family 10 (Fucosyltransferase) n=1 Tax=Rosistilla ulvae TaxID=1930277 RepID=A0A517LYP7_9BACT|nr:glycosyltransferase family 10 [Rosistilla ulvae]QDS87747.1 Glycosyltransferase family 10 (fucosyltransferase) [Rosistilla ulvae]
MYRVLVTTCGPKMHYVRQTPGRRAVWEDFEFIFNQSDVSCDAWVVFESLPAATWATCPPENVLFISAEPPTLRTYRSDFLRQFHWVLTCHEVTHRGLIARQQALPWHVGIQFGAECHVALDYDQLSAMSYPEKTHVMSVVISNKATTPGHRQRLEFVQQLKEHLGEALDVFGNGHHPIADKWEAVAPYRFHLALENTAHPDYISEKIADAFLGFAYPFYFGAPNADEYLPQDSFTPIDIFQPQQAIDSICSGIEQRLDVAHRQQVAAARKIVLDDLNLFPTLVALLRERMQHGDRQQVCLYPKNQHVQLALRSVGQLFRKCG